MRTFQKVERDTRPFPVGLPQAHLHIAWSIPPVDAGHNLAPFVGSPDIHLVPITNLSVPLFVRHLAIVAGVEPNELGGGAANVDLSLWRADSPRSGRDEQKGVWSAELLQISQTGTRNAWGLEDEPTLDVMLLPMSVGVLLEPPQIYFIGLRAASVDGGQLVVRCPQGPLAGNQFFAARRGGPTPGFRGGTPRRITAVDETQHFFASALSDVGKQFFLRRGE